jgi:formamidopyrimidine-DNA glycosylase
MPEYPDIIVYIEALEERILGERLERARLASPFLLRTVRPPLEAAHGQKVTELRRIGKRIAIGLENGIWLALHLMIMGRLHWREKGAKLPGKIGLAAFDFSSGALAFTESGSKKRAALHVVEGEQGLEMMNPGGVEVFEVGVDAFRIAITSENHTLKRALTDARLLSGVGNAYSDEILHRAKLSPFTLTSSLNDEETKRLYHATRTVLTEWTGLLREKAGGGFPEKVTAFHDEMAVHGKYNQPCPVCGTSVQRIRYAERETNYCPACQTGGKVYADRGLSRLLKKDWPRTMEELESLYNRPR